MLLSPIGNRHTTAMNLNEADQRELQAAAESLRAELSRLGERLAAVERLLQRPKDSPPTSSASATEPALSDETLIYIITAAVAAYLGVKPHIRQIRLLGGTSW